MRGAIMTNRNNDKLTEKKLATDFDKVQREVTEQIRRYEEQYPELARPVQTGDEVVPQPVFRYDVHAAS
jgi:hypothetical protein